MSPNRRIFLNIVATYGRSLYSLAVGLLTARWALNALGVVDYGLMGLVGGLTVFVSFLNSVMAGAISRFYAFGVGAANVSIDKRVGLENCRRWFSIAILIYVVLFVMLITIEYPIED